MKKVKIKCDLCEGLIVDGRCVECGMYYQKYQGTYYLNERRPAHDTNQEAYESKSYEKSIEERRRQVEQKRMERLRREQEQQRQAQAGQTKTSQYQTKQSQTRQAQSSQYQSRQTQSNQYRTKQSQTRQAQSGQGQLRQTQSSQYQSRQTQTGSKTYSSQQKSAGTNTSSARATGTGKKNNKMGAIISIIFIIIALAGEVLETVDFSTHESTIAPERDSYDIVYEYEDEFEYDDDYEDENYDIYQFVTKEMPEDGEDYDIYLTNGNYVVGQQIPEGIYTAMMPAEPMMAVAGSWFTLEDEANFISKSWWIDEGEEQNGYYVVEDIRLYEGAKLEILAYGEVLFHTENGQLQTMQEPIANPMTQVVNLTDETLLVGEDIEPGMYDAIWVSGKLTLNISRADGYEYWYELFKEEDYECTSFCNIMLQEGDTVTLETYSEEEGCVLLCSSPEIFESTEQ
ncbi:MAG: hypothetical protein U0L12_04730 [Ruminococcus sp.]|nr:hypothetical protein [Ruminococcus sp.]